LTVSAATPLKVSVIPRVPPLGRPLTPALALAWPPVYTYVSQARAMVSKLPSFFYSSYSQARQTRRAMTSNSNSE
jgi:hypothetical protein